MCFHKLRISKHILETYIYSCWRHSGEMIRSSKVMVTSLITIEFLPKDFLWSLELTHNF